MSRKTVRPLFLCLCALLACAPQASAWQVEIEGSMDWTHEYYSQRGGAGFFGPYNVDLGAATTTANLNFWMGNQIGTMIATGANAGRSYFNLNLEPTIKINEAIRLKGKYHLGQYGNPNASDYYTQDSPGTDNAFSEGQWTLFWATAVTPWGTFAIGKRPWMFGTGLQYDGSDGLTTESMMISAPAGPLDIGVGFYPYRYAGVSTATSNSGDPFDLPIPPYFNQADRSGSFIKDAFAFIMYHEGPVQMGVIASYGDYHIGPEAQLVNTGGGALANPWVSLESVYHHGSVFFKYFNGRFFFNTEAAWLYWRDALKGPGVLPPGFVQEWVETVEETENGPVVTPVLTTTVIGPNPAFPTGLLPTPRYVEQWRFMAETGVVVGPSKLSLLYARTPGPDRRAGVLIGKQSAAFVRHPTYDAHLGNFSMFQPYCYLLGYNYGGGLNAYNLSGDGYLRDAWILGGRFDFAVAANLNLYGTFVWAERTNNGYGWGCIAPNDPADPLAAAYAAPAPPAAPVIPIAVLAPTGVNDGNIRIDINGAPGSPNIPDGALGYEINAGLDWKLLEGLTASALFAYWKPGKWFNYACVHRSVPGWDVPTPANFWGTRPDKTIDPIMGGMFALSFSF